MSGPLPSLTPAQANRIAGAYRFNSKTVLDVGPSVKWTSPLGKDSQSVIDGRDASMLSEQAVTRVTLAGSLPVKQHQCDLVLVRAASVLQAASPTNPESIIGAANLLSCVKGKGLLVSVMASADDLEYWQRLFEGFPGTAQTRILTGGLLALPILSWLTRPAPPVYLFEFRLAKKAVSRLEWHQLARQRVMGQKPLAPAA